MESPFPDDFEDADEIINQDIDMEQVILALLLLWDDEARRRATGIYGEITRVTSDIRGSGFRLTGADQRRLNGLLAETERIATGLARDAVDGARSELLEVAREESDFWAARLNLPNVPSQELLDSFDNQPYLGRTIGEDATRLEEAISRVLREAIDRGVRAGDSLEEILARVRGTDGPGNDRGALDSVRSFIRQFIATAGSHAITVGREASARNLWAERGTGEDRPWAVHTSVLDRRTSNVCIKLAGTVYTVLREIRWPPIHPNCRSRIALGRGAATQFPDGESFLERQSPRRQDEILGPTRAAMFRSGELAVVDLADSQTLLPLSLDQIRQRNAERNRRTG